MPVRSFVLKVTNRCNISCDYCYVFNSADQIARDLPVRMSDSVVVAAATRIREYCLEQRIPVVRIIFHGGEPLLLGIRRTTELLDAFRARLAPVDVRYSLQTNGVLVDAAWASLFAEYQVDVGVSLDGPPVVNDRHRLGHRGQSTASAAVAGIEQLKNQGVLAGILAVIDLTAEPGPTYDYLASLGPPVIDFSLPHATFDTPPRRSPGRPAEYGEWLSVVFDHWRRSDGTVRVRTFNDIIALQLGAVGATDALGLARSGTLTIESDGGIESFDALRSVRKGESQIGLSVFRHSLTQACEHPALRDRRVGPWDELSATCQNCDVVNICGGGYKPHRFSSDTAYRNPSVYCDDLRNVIELVGNAVQERLTGNLLENSRGVRRWRADDRS